MTCIQAHSVDVYHLTWSVGFGEGERREQIGSLFIFETLTDPM